MADEGLLCLLGLIILSSLLTGTSGAYDAHVFISSGENVRLPCNNVFPDCKSTRWVYSSNSTAVTLIEGGKKKDRESRERLSLGSDCSLNIKNITREDSGSYTCRQYVNDKQLGTDARVFLHVLYVSSSSSSSSQTKISAGRSMTLFCQLYSYNGFSCDWIRSEGIKLSWVSQAGVKLKSADSRYQIFSSDHCIISLNTTLLNEDHNRERRCAVTHRNQVKISATSTGNSSGSSGVDETHVFISSGENAHLSCNNALRDCTSTRWIYNRVRHASTVELVAGGIKKDTENHKRLSLRSDCSLNINNITKEDSGAYTCQQYVNDKQQGTDARVYLHILCVSTSSSQTEISAGRSVTFSCQLYSFEGLSCDEWIRSEGIELLWVNQAGVKLTRSDSRYQISAPGHCIITLNTTLLNEDHNREWRCAVTHRNQVKISATYTVKISVSPVHLTNSQDPLTTNKHTTKDPAETEVCRTFGSVFREILIILQTVAFVTPTVILLQIICARRAERKNSQHREEIVMNTILG